MKEDLITTLKKLKDIEPDRDYAKQSRMFILAHSQNPAGPKAHFFGLFRLSAVMAVMALAAFSLLRGVFYINTTYSPLTLDGLNQNSLASEADGINQSIQNTLNEINKLDKSNRTAIETMSEISKSADFRVLSATTTADPDKATSTAVENAIENIGDFLIKNPSSTDQVIIDDTDLMLEKISQ